MVSWQPKERNRKKGEMICVNKFETSVGKMIKLKNMVQTNRIDVCKLLV